MIGKHQFLKLIIILSILIIGIVGFVSLDHNFFVNAQDQSLLDEANFFPIAEDNGIPPCPISISITDITVSDITSNAYSDSFKISWKTNVDTRGIVRYGIAANNYYGSKNDTTEAKKDHSITITTTPVFRDTSKGVTYHFQIKAYIDDPQEFTTSDDQAFSIDAFSLSSQIQTIPYPTGAIAGEISQTGYQMYTSWKDFDNSPDKVSKTELEYGTTQSYGSAVTATIKAYTNDTYEARVDDQTLGPGVYHFRAKYYKKDDTIAYSSDSVYNYNPISVFSYYDSSLIVDATENGHPKVRVTFLVPPVQQTTEVDVGVVGQTKTHLTLNLIYNLARPPLKYADIDVPYPVKLYDLMLSNGQNYQFRLTPRIIAYPHPPGGYTPAIDFYNFFTETRYYSTGYPYTVTGYNRACFYYKLTFPADHDFLLTNRTSWTDTSSPPYESMYGNPYYYLAFPMGNTDTINHQCFDRKFMSQKIDNVYGKYMAIDHMNFRAADGEKYTAFINNPYVRVLGHP